MRAVAHVTKVEPRQDYVLHLWFADGTDKDVDIRPLIRGALFKPMIEDINVFRAVKVDDEIGTIVWPNGADLDPEVLRYDLKPAWMEEEEAERAKNRAV